MENSLLHNVYNPDVLSCIANLSNDEVFTPPELANKSLTCFRKNCLRIPIQDFSTHVAKAEFSFVRLPRG